MLADLLNVAQSDAHVAIREDLFVIVRPIAGAFLVKLPHPVNFLAKIHNEPNLLLDD